MFGFKLFSPITRVGTKDRLRRRLAREQAAHDHAIERLYSRIRFLNGQLREHCDARQAVTVARVELELDVETVGHDIETALIEDGSISDHAAHDHSQVVRMSDVLGFADLRAAARENRT